MASSLYRLLIYTCLCFFFCAPELNAQSTDFRQDNAFFLKKKQEFNHWLKQNQLDRVLWADSVSVGPQSVTLYIRPVYRGQHLCDSLQCAWNRLEQSNKKLNGQFFHERLLHKWAFLSEIHEDQALVVVRCHEPAHFLAKVSCARGKIPVETRNLRSAVVVEVSTPTNLQGVNTGDNKMLLYNKNVYSVCQAARRYLCNVYKAKGTPVLWRARIDSSYTAYDEFVLEVTHLSNEICPDGYFEYHRIYVKGLQKGNDVEVSWEFQGKYGSGILFPPRKNDYKDMELRYKNNLEEYQRQLFKKLMDALRS